MRLLLDEMLSPRIAAQLRDRGFDVIAIAETPALRQQPDEIVFANAQDESRTIVTRNIRDFRILAKQALAAGRRHHGLILVSNRRFPGHDPGAIGQLVEALSEILSKSPDISSTEYWLS